jgi:hypothetical protein
MLTIYQTARNHIAKEINMHSESRDKFRPGVFLGTLNFNIFFPQSKEFLIHKHAKKRESNLKNAVF